MKTEYLSKDQNWTDGTTIYWFEIEGHESLNRYGSIEVYGVCDHNGEISYLDCDGCPVRPEDISPLDRLNLLTDEIINS